MKTKLFSGYIINEIINTGSYALGKAIRTTLIGDENPDSCFRTYRLIFSDAYNDLLYEVDYTMNICSSLLLFKYANSSKTLIECKLVGSTDTAKFEGNALYLTRRTLDFLRENGTVTCLNGMFSLLEKSTEALRLGERFWINEPFKQVDGFLHEIIFEHHLPTDFDLNLKYSCKYIENTKKDLNNYEELLCYTRIKADDFGGIGLPADFLTEKQFFTLAQQLYDSKYKDLLTVLVLENLESDVHENAVAKGFWNDERSIGESIALIHSELSEALEAARKDFPKDDHVDHGAFETELADAIIRILDLAESQRLDIGRALIDKMKYNASRPYKHGKKF